MGLASLFFARCATNFAFICIHSIFHICFFIILISSSLFVVIFICNAFAAVVSLEEAAVLQPGAFTFPEAPAQVAAAAAEAAKQ